MTAATDEPKTNHPRFRRDAPTHWYNPTPDRLVLSLLAVEGVVLLSDWFCWLPFNQYKDRTVLVALAAVGATLVLFVLWFLASLLFRWRFQYSLRSLLLLVVAAAVVCSWLATEMQRERSQYELARAIVAAGGKAGGVPTWLGKLLRDDSLGVMTCVDLSGTAATDADLCVFEG